MAASLCRKARGGYIEVILSNEHQRTSAKDFVYIFDEKAVCIVIKLGAADVLNI